MKTKLKEKINLLRVFREFRKEMREEKANPESEFNKFKLNLNDFGDVVYIQFDFDEAAFMSADYNSERMVTHKLKPIDKYLRSDLGWDEVLDLNISRFYTEDGEPTHSYAISYKFVGVVDIINEFLRKGLIGLGAVLFIAFVIIMAIVL